MPLETSSATPLLDGLSDELPGLEDIYRDLHRHPELSHAEHRTAGIVAARVRELGYDVTEGVGGTGVVGVLANGAGPTVLLRADMDGLPVAEDPVVPYRSEATGIAPDGTTVPVMHACGHDTHVTSLLGALGQLARHREAWSGTVLAVFQPAEELGTGARSMLADGFLDRFPRPDVALGQHVMPAAAGTVLYCSGPAMSSVDTYHVTVFGRGGHGSAPQTTVDPVVVAASIVLRLQTIVSREVSPEDFAVVTVGSIVAGTKDNIIPDTAVLKITMRTYERAVRDRVDAAIRRIVEAECQAAATPRPPDIDHGLTLPATVNDAAATERAVAGMVRTLGPDRVQVGRRVTPSEDFGLFAEAAGCPSVFWFFGGFDPELCAARPDEVPSNHSPRFVPVPEPTLSGGIAAVLGAASAWLGTPRD